MKFHLICAIPLFTCLILDLRARSEVVPEKQLLIIDPEVVDSTSTEYPGFLSVGHLFDELSPDGSGGDLVRNWLELWMLDLEVNGSLVAARPRVKELVIEPWQHRDGWVAERDGEWRPNLANAPFRLLAVVNRIDLSSAGRATGFYYGSGKIGRTNPQGRLVFGILGDDGEPLGRHFTVIFEYELPIKSEDIGAYALLWEPLGQLDFGDPNYLMKLHQVVRQFTDHKLSDKGERIPPPLAQLRTNDMALDEICELREFKLVKGGRQFRQVPLPNTPSTRFVRNGGRFNRLLGEFIAEDGTKAIPLGFDAPTGSRRLLVLAGSSLIPDAGFYWESNRIGNTAARHNFSVRTCNGCHAADTNTDFCHISPRKRGEPSELSKFLRMSTEPFKIIDPGDRRRKITSAEMKNRIGSFQFNLAEAAKTKK